MKKLCGLERLTCIYSFCNIALQDHGTRSYSCTKETTKHLIELGRMTPHLSVIVAAYSAGYSSGHVLAGYDVDRLEPWAMEMEDALRGAYGGMISDGS